MTSWPYATLATRFRLARWSKLPDLPGGQLHPCWAKKNQIRIPHRTKHMGRPRLNVHCCRSRPAYGRVWHLMHGQDMGARWQPGVIAVTLCDVGDRPAIDLEMVSQIPSKVWRSLNDQTPSRLSGRSSDRDNPGESKNQKQSADAISQAAHDLL